MANIRVLKGNHSFHSDPIMFIIVILSNEFTTSGSTGLPVMYYGNNNPISSIDRIRNRNAHIFKNEATNA